MFHLSFLSKSLSQHCLFIKDVLITQHNKCEKRCLSVWMHNGNSVLNLVHPIKIEGLKEGK